LFSKIIFAFAINEFNFVPRLVFLKIVQRLGFANFSILIWTPLILLYERTYGSICWALVG
jgi:hypothetical protein